MSNIWTPHATVACVVEKNGKFLMVEELSHGQRVYNQPAGHVDEGESIFEAAVRETLEETAWRVELTGLVGLYVYTAPQNGVCYHRYCFSAQALEHTSNALDADILAAHWLSYAEIISKGENLRSPLVLRCIDDARTRTSVPLNFIYEHPFSKIDS
ncbi:NUDIX hydrolase [Oleiphilus sp. HI0071]|uniref:NUDIX hydrolase n=1 Tax=unclassified Oleiphilus TaxID=2631174 RepID=UPI0007C2EFE1|nr:MULTISPECIES: NUDIX hydrolase [unclassified Oleiphilus]KZY59091.1 NUDIX hydrolase [Oleiphilus sp. HI0065]KZY79658.1 NUDIX hydrolase [Oleiphilus sp. HI0071]KZZ05401.1 NUDIX hydrolase [Oleiphilus sp. HI0073]KZZ51967.1 NUDIX hydrolase [Oleiphilus sp. HI0122]KZZ78309.1 NUDIX hydrolase [Oleiphilus sp. HI0133]